MAQVSGSISLELGKVVRETARATLAGLLTQTAPEGEVTPLEEISAAVASGVAEAIMPALAILGNKVDRMIGLLENVATAEAIVRRATGTQPAASVLEWDNLVATLSHHLPAGTSHPKVGDGLRVAEFQAAHLSEAGYAIVPVSGEALSGLAATQETTVVRGPDGAPLYQLPPDASGELEAIPANRISPEASARADARLADARRNGSDDSWYEEV